MDKSMYFYVRADKDRFIPINIKFKGSIIYNAFEEYVPIDKITQISTNILYRISQDIASQLFTISKQLQDAEAEYTKVMMGTPSARDVNEALGSVLEASMQHREYTDAKCFCQLLIDIYDMNHKDEGVIYIGIGVFDANRFDIDGEDMWYGA